MYGPAPIGLAEKRRFGKQAIDLVDSLDVGGLDHGELMLEECTLALELRWVPAKLRLLCLEGAQCGASSQQRFPVNPGERIERPAHSSRGEERLMLMLPVDGAQTRHLL